MIHDGKNGFLNGFPARLKARGSPKNVALVIFLSWKNPIVVHMDDDWRVPPHFFGRFRGSDLSNHTMGWIYNG